ncbi:NAD-dependent DNA ligase LigA [[Mycoplasma] anseris]|uniref:DNA ligase n=1 Tax=[Mycoplasma] anseris TaxID=92400 RepID=A0A2Z4NCD1_9BACT|nr:NAD-dependent DNA ligase LigA [[Mycoplasma] anseris]AWX69213.1 NAD-dependent DNA ligase LigA [[Mycoplasma] anseris]
MTEKEKIRKEVFELQEKINYWDDAYYNHDNPIVEDAIYDKEILRLKKLEEQYANYFTYEELINSPTQKINAKASDNFQKVAHDKPMLSLNKAYSLDEIEKFINNIKKITLDFSFYIEPKIDGLSISLKYKNGKLVQAVTRGDGIIGEDVTENIKQLKNIPLTIQCLDDLEVRGEVYLALNDFNQLNKILESQNKPKMANPRNGAAGTLRQLDPLIVKERNLSAFIYYVVDPLKHNIQTMKQSFDFLSNLGFSITNETRVVKSLAEIEQYITWFKQIKTSLDYETDGIVIKLNELEYYDELGSTVKFPHSAIAFKYEPNTETTVLKRIFATVGRTGLVTYNAELEPVYLSGSKINFATLNNFQYVKDLNLNLNDLVYIKKAGEIIPCVIGLVNKKAKEDYFKKIDSCPYCAHLLVDSDTSLEQYCLNENCPEIFKKKMIHFTSKDAMDINSLGEKNIEIFIENKLITKLIDFYTLKDKKDEILKIERFGHKSVMNILNSIELSKKNPLNKLIFAFSIKHIGAKVAKFIASKVQSLNCFLDFNFNDLIQYNEIGEKIVNSLNEWVNKQENIDLVNQLLNMGINAVYEESFKTNLLQNKTFVITGTLSKSRTYFEKQIIENGGNIANSVSKNTSYLLMGLEPGSKLKKAKELNVPIIDEDIFEKMINGD